MKNNHPVIEMEHFTFFYEDSKYPSLSDVTLKINAGEVVLLTGKSGCGKTTFTRCINGLIPDFFEGVIEGSCTVCEMEIKKQETGDYAPFVGSVFQDPRSQFFTLHVKTEIPFPSENLGHERGNIQNHCIEAIELFDLYNVYNKNIFNLSSGEKQKIAVASVYAAGVHVFVLDEPSANLDEVGTKQLLEILQRLKAQGHTIIISEHRVHYLKDLIDRIILLKDGKIAVDLDQTQLTLLTPERRKEYALRQFDLDDIIFSPPVFQKSMMERQISAQDLTFYYHKKSPLWNHVSFTATGGDIVGVIGRNGVGKSTLCRILMGLEKQCEGKITVNQKKVSKKQRRNLSFYVMQDVDYQLFASSVLEEMLLGTSESEEDHQKAVRTLEYFGLSDYSKVHPSRLSGGQKQRLSIALAYMSNAKILFMDEPTSGLDGENMNLVSHAIRELAKKGCIIFVITHDYEFAAGTFRSLIVFDDKGKVTRVPPDKYKAQELYQKFHYIKGDMKHE